MDDLTLVLKSEINSIVCKAEALIKDHKSETATIYLAIENVLFLLPKSDQKSTSDVLCSHHEQACMIFVGEYYTDFGEFFVENFNLKWLHSDDTDSENRVILLFDKYFLNGPDEESFRLLCHAISVECLQVLRIHCLQLLEDLLKKGCIKRILELYCCGPVPVMQMSQRLRLSDNELARLPQWQTLLSAISSLPDVLLAKASRVEAGTFLFPQSYVSFVGSEILAVLKTVYSRLQNGLDSSVLFLSLLVGKMSLCGYGELLLKSLLTELEPLCIGDFLWRRIAQRLFSGIPDRCLESVIAQLVVLVSSPNALSMILGNMPVTSPKLAYILSHKLLLVRCSDGPVAVHILRNITGYLASSSELSALFTSTFRSLLSSWADASSLRHRPLEQSLYVSKAVVAFITYASPEAISESREDILRYMLDGLPSYLGSSIATVRQIGSVVAEKLSEAVHSANENEPLRFNVEKNEIVESILELCELPIDKYSAGIKSKEKKLDMDSEVVTETFNSLSLQVGNEKRGSYSAESKEDLDSGDDDTELKPYAAFASEPESAKRPIYLAQCIDGLIKQDDPESVEQSLLHIETLIKRANVTTVHEVGVELCRILLHLEDQFALINFTVLRYRAMVALIVTTPALIAEYLGAEFYARNYNIRQRMDILDVLAAGATELAEPPKATSSSPTVPENADLVPMKDMNASQDSNWSDIVRARVEAKTRRFAKGRQHPLPASAPNRFAGVAGSFFYPLLRHFDRQSDSTLDLLGSDHLVFERLIYTLGAVMLAATGTPAAGKMGTALLEFLRCSRHHVEAGVRRANLYAACTSLAAMPNTAVLDDPAAFNDLGNWLHNVLGRDADAECRHRASQALQLLNASFKQVCD